MRFQVALKRDGVQTRVATFDHDYRGENGLHAHIRNHVIHDGEEIDGTIKRLPTVPARSAA